RAIGALNGFLHRKVRYGCLAGEVSDAVRANGDPAHLPLAEIGRIGQLRASLVENGEEGGAAESVADSGGNRTEGHCRRWGERQVGRAGSTGDVSHSGWAHA